MQAIRMCIGVGLCPRKHTHSLQRLHSLAFGCETFAYAKDQASSPRDGLLKDYPTPYSNDLSGIKYQARDGVAFQSFNRQDGISLGYFMACRDKHDSILLLSRPSQRKDKELLNK
jgi:hypothetical protein